MFHFFCIKNLERSIPIDYLQNYRFIPPPTMGFLAETCYTTRIMSVSQSPRKRVYPLVWAMLPMAMGAVGVAGAIGLIGILLLARGQLIMREELRERLRSTAAAAAMQFDGDDITLFRTEADTARPAFKAVVGRLQTLRGENPDIRYAYIMRRTSEPMVLTFVADADMFVPPEELDKNHNGGIDADEESSQLGDEYDASGAPVMHTEAFIQPSVDADITMDQWGRLISGYAPIRNSAGQTVAILGLDMAADRYITISQRMFSPVALLLMTLATVTIGAALVLLSARRRVEHLRQIEMERSGLFRLAFHQLGGPLSIVKWSLEILREEQQGDKPMPAMDDMAEGVTRLENILHTLHDADVVHSGKVRYEAEDTSLNAIIRQVTREIGERLERRGLTLRMELGPDVPMKLDRKLMSSVLRELLNNAIDFSYEGKEIIVRTSVRDGIAECSIQDFGGGIPKEDLPRIFTEFSRGRNANKFKPDGSGLGLYIVRGIIEQAGGKIWATSREELGTTVSFTLPLRR